jgi:cell division FtsZ-interacting protein ZapD
MNIQANQLDKTVPTLYESVESHPSITDHAKEIKKQREYIKSHLDLMGLKYDAIDITCIREQLSEGYRAIDVAIEYGKHYRNKHRG